MSWSFDDKVALITGAGAGAGLATAHAFAAAGAAVILADLDEAAIRAAADALVGAGHTAVAIGCDIADDTQAAALVDQAIARFGHLDAAFNNAAGVRGVATCMTHELRPMLRQRGGAIVNCVRMDGAIAARRGVIELTKIAAQDYAAKGIRVSALCPGGFSGGAPEEVARAALWLCSPWARHVMGIPSPWTTALRRAEAISEARALAHQPWG